MTVEVDLDVLVLESNELGLIKPERASSEPLIREPRRPRTTRRCPIGSGTGTQSRPT